MAEVQAPKPILAEKDSNVPAAVAGSKPAEQGSSDAAKVWNAEGQGPEPRGCPSVCPFPMMFRAIRASQH